MQISPRYTLLFICAVFAVLAGIMAVFPKDGVAVTSRFTLDFPTFGEFFKTTEPDRKDLSLILNMKLDTASDKMIDSTAILKKISRQKAIRDSIRKTLMHLQFPAASRSALYPFFEKLDQLQKGGRHIRVLHYGDSQIEGDRISSYLRYHLQRKFGGRGPGLIPAMQPIPSISVTQHASGNWNRYTMFGLRDSTVTHNRFGVMASFSRFLPVLADTAPVPQEMAEAWITIQRAASAYANSREFDQCRMYFSHNRVPVIAAMYISDQIIRTDTLKPSQRLQMLQWDFETTPESFTIRFAGQDSPDIYALALDGKRGIAVDNIPMRGSAGTVFSKMDRDMLKALYDDLEPELLILQFGGNVMPYMDDAEDAEQYGRSFKYQIQRLKSLRPGLSVIVIGPSDLSIKEKDAFVTYPLLEKVRDALKKATFDAGGVYWDLYEVMGGKNSMPLWVEADPPLAAKDYIHFSPKGARKVAELFYSALIREYDIYKKNRQQP